MVLSISVLPVEALDDASVTSVVLEAAAGSQVWVGARQLGHLNLPVTILKSALEREREQQIFHIENGLVGLDSLNKILIPHTAR